VRVADGKGGMTKAFGIADDLVEEADGNKILDFWQAQAFANGASLAKHLAPATVNRTASALKTALNLVANHDEFITNRQSWENGLATIPGAEESRNVILAEPAIRTIMPEAHRESIEFGLLVEIAAVTGARGG
jgi:hypothetical protein